MKAAVLREANTPLTIEEVQVDKPGRGEVLVRTAAAGVCHSDLHYVNGTYPMLFPVILGHEASGVVEAVGEGVNYVKPGDHVITCLSGFCGHCRHCLTGHTHRCGKKDLRRDKDQPARLELKSNRVTQFAGLSAFAEQMLIHENFLVRVTPEIPLDRAALIGCAVTTGVGAVFRTAAVRPGSTVAVIGCGGIGLSAINGAAIAGAGRIIGIDLSDSKLELARSFGATDVLNAGDGNPVEAVQNMTRGGVDYAFEAVGLKQTSEQAFAMTRTGGTATVIGMLPPGVKVEVDGMELLREKKLQGSNMGSNQFRIDMPRLVDFYLQGRLHLDQLLSRRIGLGEINEAFADLEKGEVARSVIVFDQ